MNFNQTIAFCPRCGSDCFPEKSSGFFLCGACDFRFHPNCAAAVAGIIVNEAGEILLIRRNRNPGKGKWSVPGGFVDSGETAEFALAREIQEEVGLQTVHMDYLCSFANPYEYHGVVFSVLDFIYVCHVSDWNTLQNAPDEVGEHILVLPSAIDLDEIAFPSIRHALKTFSAKRSG